MPSGWPRSAFSPASPCSADPRCAAVSRPPWRAPPPRLQPSSSRSPSSFWPPSSWAASAHSSLCRIWCWSGLRELRCGGPSRGWRGSRGAENGSWPARRPLSTRVRTRGPEHPTSRSSIALAIATLAVLHFAQGVHQRLGTGMTGFDSTWYHAPFAAGFFQSGDTWSVHHIAPQFLAWFYPANAEVAHAVGMLSFDRDLISPFLNLGWMLACLLAAWCVGRPFGVAPWSLALVAVALSVPALGDQAGEARNDLAGTFFLLAAAAIALCACDCGRSERAPSHWRSARRRALRRPGSGDQARLRDAGGRLRRRPGARGRARPATAGARCHRGSRVDRRRLLVPAQSRPHRQPASMVRLDRADLPARTRAGARRARTAQRGRLPDRRPRLVGMVSARAPPRAAAALAAAARRRGGRAWSLRSGGGRRPPSASPASPALPPCSPGWSPRHPPPAPTACRTASSPASATWPPPSPWASPCSPVMPRSLPERFRMVPPAHLRMPAPRTGARMDVTPTGGYSKRRAH